jgi:hypothetical protein
MCTGKVCLQYVPDIYDKILYVRFQVGSGPLAFAYMACLAMPGKVVGQPIKKATRKGRRYLNYKLPLSLLDE